MVYGAYAEQQGYDRGGMSPAGNGSRARSSSSAFLVQVSENLADFADAWPVLADLESLPDVRSFPFQCRDHLLIWQETIGAARKVQPVFVHVSDESSGPLMMVPLGIRTRHGVRVLSFLDEGIADYNAPVLYRAASKTGAKETMDIWNAICRAAPPFDVAMLQKMPSAVGDFGNPLAALARRPWPMAGHILRLKGDASDEPLQSKHVEKENRRRRRRLAEIGAVSFNVVTSDSEANNVFEIFVRQKLERYRETLGIEDFDVPGQRAYYLALTRRLFGRNVQLFWLAVGEEIIATAWCLCAGRRLYYMMCASERTDRWRRFAPGSLLLEDLVNWSANNGFEVFDFGIGDEDYKLNWRQTPVPLYSALHARTAKGHAWCTVVDMREGLKRRLPRGFINLTKRMVGKTAPAEN